MRKNYPSSVSAPAGLVDTQLEVSLVTLVRMEESRGTSRVGFDVSWLTQVLDSDLCGIWLEGLRADILQDKSE